MKNKNGRYIIYNPCSIPDSDMTTDFYNLIRLSLGKNLKKMPHRKRRRN